MGEKLAVPGEVLNDRVINIDVARAFAFVGVVFIHADGGSLLGQLLSDISRFAVPFFFLMSGFFMRSPKNSLPSPELKATRRVVVPFVLWVLVYIFVSRPTWSEVINPYYILRTAWTGGPGLHLWFLPHLLIAQLMMYVLLRFQIPMAALLGVAAACYLGGEVLGPYSHSSFAFSRSPSFTRIGPTFGLPFIILGYWIAQRRVNTTPETAGAILISGIILTQFEEHVLLSGKSGVLHDNLLFTPLLGVGFFLLFRSVLLPRRLAVPIAAVGQLSLGLFCVHLLFVWMMRDLTAASTWLVGHAALREAVTVVIVIGLSVLSCLAMQRVPLLRPLIR